MTDDDPRTCILSGDKPHPLAPTELQTCQRCVGRTRANLYAVADAYRLLPAVLGQLGSNAPRDRIPAAELDMLGGDALVMLAGGSAALAGLRAYIDGRNRHWADDNPDNDPLPVAYALGRWEDDWRRWRGEPAASEPMTVAGAFEYLRGERLSWAAQWHLDFAEFGDDLKTLRWRLEHMTATSTAPIVEDLECFDCGTRKALIRHYCDKEADDYWTCRKCHCRYDQPSYWLAVRAKIEADKVAS